MLVAASLLLAGVYAFDVSSWRSLGLDPQLTAQSALVASFLAQEGFLIGVVALMTAYIALRNSRGLVTRPHNNSFDLVVIFIAYTAAQSGLSALLVRLYPGGA